jgi:hypothetical protein
VPAVVSKHTASVGRVNDTDLLATRNVPLVDAVATGILIG